MAKINITEGKYSVEHNGRLTKKGIEIHGPDGCYALKPFLEYGKIPSKDIYKKAMFLIHESNDHFLKKYGGITSKMTEDVKDQKDLLKLVRNIGLSLKKDIFIHNQIKEAYNIIDGIVFKNIKLPMNHDEVKLLSEQGQKLNISPRMFNHEMIILGFDNFNYLIIDKIDQETILSKKENIVRVPDYIDIEINLDEFYQNEHEHYGKQFILIEAFNKNNKETSNFSRVTFKDNKYFDMDVRFKDVDNIKNFKYPILST